MSRWSLRALLCFTLLGCGKAAVPFSYTVAPERYEIAHARSIEWIEKALMSGKLSDEHAEVAQEILAVLDSVQIHYIENIKGSPCEEDELRAAFVLNPHEKMEIFVCPLLDQYSKSRAAQTFIHESIHLSGNEDECSTTEQEARIIFAAGVVPEINGYVRSCDLAHLWNEASVVPIIEQ